MSKWIKKEDKVLVIAGNDKGKLSEVVSRKGDKVIVKGVNVRRKNVKSDKNKKAQAVYVEMPIHVSNLSLVDKDGKKIRLKVKFENGNKELVYIRDKKEILHRIVSKKIK
jgi:large subunit ribosomal protein L24